MDAIERRILVDGVVCTCSAVVRARLLGWMDRGRGCSAVCMLCWCGQDYSRVVGGGDGCDHEKAVFIDLH